MKKLSFIVVVAVLVLVAGCGRKEEVPMGQASERATGVTASDAVVAALDSFSANLASDKFKSQSGVLADGKLGNAGKDGYLLFGPYVPFKAGTYTVTFVGEVNDLPEGAKVRLDVDSNNGASVHGGIDAVAVGALPSFEFVLPNDVADLEVRVLVQGGAKVSVASYSVTKKR